MEEKKIQIIEAEPGQRSFTGLYHPWLVDGMENLTRDEELLPPRPRTPKPVLDGPPCHLFVSVHFGLIDVPIAQIQSSLQRADHVFFTEPALEPCRP